MTVRCGTVEFETALIICDPFLMIPSASKSFPTMKPVMFWKNTSGTSMWLQSWMKWAAFWAESG